MRRSGHGGRCTALAAAMLMAASPAAAQRADHVDAAVRQLRRAVTKQRRNLNIPLLVSLRQLRDPALKSLFYQLARYDDWQVQVHAVLGLAEIDPEGRLDPWLITQIDPRGQEHVVAHALDVDLLGDEEIQELLAWRELKPMARLLLLGELVLEDKPVERTALTSLRDDADLRVAALSGCLLLQVDPEAPLDAYRERLSGLDRRQRQNHLTWLADAIRQYRLTASLPVLIEGIQTELPSRGLETAGLLAVLELDPARGLPLWQRALGDDPPQRDRVRLGLLLLAAGAAVPPETFDALSSNDALVEAIGDVGRALARGDDPVPAMTALVALGHVRSTTWAMSAARKLSPDRAAALYEQLIDTVDESSDGEDQRISVAVTAVSRLFEMRPEQVLGRLRAAPDDSLAQQVLLLGLFDSTNPAVGEAAAAIEREGPGRTDSMALILMARHLESLEPNDLRLLGVIAAGGGRVSDLLQVQAAWLYLRQTGHVEAALGRIFSKNPTLNEPSHRARARIATGKGRLPMPSMQVDAARGDPRRASAGSF